MLAPVVAREKEYQLMRIGAILLASNFSLPNAPDHKWSEIRDCLALNPVQTPTAAES